MKPQLSQLDKLISSFDRGLRTIFAEPQGTNRKNPAKNIEDNSLSDADKQLSIRLMRVNHAGEVAAQALYQGQALTAHDSRVRDSMHQSAIEENDHLLWCEKRIQALGGRTSVLNPVWYTGSFAMGALAGFVGDKWSLGFVAETEKQVIAHLETHLQTLPIEDQKSRAILEQMKQDEAHHATIALEAGGVPLPMPVQIAMQATAKIMTTTAYWI
ncbi:2-polyprenyl-3-methyl-6-methoxy-1,4-benzoquinone monooxygenase [Beggiatoa leptomitoformis]|uniref:3-demethoxyubiquinol 3-hydroxylase n=1 Tax=Beggiatoa leptomitoformis TaxID=288004 RepID=A0A2N9YBG5_9GAMM|nr:2-polyprenyl-3-methyl-6-methoxy-1,4-benzoquinone monooxygenase [Beggiatoa leptomitoformis]ALG66827.1 2-polyprenyl-3-methyl-6-methoxy-1,4-benzoquinone monooxygenase [Beggiatoa leptomitoformis]AUI67820.1 2-polyprenyl-3-methyl-6-methoxy-1,4-benzoquinone monooxygenase [Beggiatoa leptomitoformis]